MVLYRGKPISVELRPPGLYSELQASQDFTYKKVLFFKTQSAQAPVHTVGCAGSWLLTLQSPLTQTTLRPAVAHISLAPQHKALSRSDTDLIGSAVEPGDLQGTLQITEARLTQVLDNPAAQSWYVGRQGTLRVFQGRCGHRVAGLSHWSSLG